MQSILDAINEYPLFLGTAYGFLSRGCPRNCGFCIVSDKEGRKSVKHADLSEFWRGQDEINLMDANLLACPDHENLIEQLAKSRAYVNFSQGLDIRLITPDNVALLNRVKTKAVHFAWDNPNEDLTGHFARYLELTAIKNSRKRRVYVLTNYGSTHEQDLYRIYTLRDMGFLSYIPKGSAADNYLAPYYTGTVYLLEESVIPKFAISKTNEKAVDVCDFVVSGVCRSYGGAQQAIRYAKRRHKTIIDIFSQ